MRRILQIFTIVFICFICISCGTKNSSSTEQLSLNEPLISANQPFAFSLLKEMKNEQTDDENIVFSPASITLALLLTVNGAEGITNEEILQTLNLADYPLEEINDNFQQIQQSLLNAKDAKVKIANSIWVRDGLTLNDNFIKTADKFYKAKIASLEFADEKAAGEINRWVEKATEGLIDKMVENISKDTVAFLLNAIYFKADWLEPFDKKATAERPFYLADGTAKNHPMMYKNSEFLYLDDENFSAVKLPYNDRRFYATFILPKGNMSEFYEHLHAENVRKWTERMRETPGTIYLPRFKYEYEFTLNDVLQALGMETAFYNADFSKMFQEALDTYISEVKHKAVIEVNEQGSEASAATSVVVKETALIGEPFELEFNRPFLFMIEDSLTKTILFIGEVNDPSE